MVKVLLTRGNLWGLWSLIADFPSQGKHLNTIGEKKLPFKLFRAQKYKCLEQFLLPSAKDSVPLAQLI